jgi:phenylacetaldehyde dehydrogenase
MNQTATISLEQLPYSEAVSAFLARKPRLFIGNEWVESSHGKTLPVEDPSAGREVARIVDASDADIDRAVAAARAAFDDARWSGLAPAMRERAMIRLAELIEAHAAELGELEAIDNGKPRTMAQAGDVPMAAANLRFMAGWAGKVGGETVPPYSQPAGALFGYSVKEPVGVCAQIVPWNFPLMMACQKLAPALAAGCTMVLKPAEQTSLTALRLGDLIVEAGIPAGVINIVTGLGETAGARLVAHPDVDKVAFTGSTEVGKLIGREATHTLKRVTLELGGKSPFVVLPDADPASVGRQAAGAIFMNAGQVCVAGSRLYAHRSVFDPLLEALAQATAKSWTPRPSLDPQARMGPLVSAEQFERVMGYIDAGRKAGASVAIGGDAPSADGHYVNPTVLVDVSPEMSVVREEIFGPVLVAQRFDDLDEVAKAANDTCYGLGASIWTNDLSTMHKLAARIKSGTVWGNCHAMLDPALPFGGYKQSGIGRELGREGIEAYLETKTVMLKL